ncbi:MAG TPA: tetratricopeptide repeat protein [Anaerolineae bacterium]|nr:tetratricopeptide repeat protein [Anaerolineae bacterium]
MNELNVTQLITDAQTATNNDQYALATDLYQVFLSQTTPQTDDETINEQRMQALAELGRLLLLLGNPTEALAYYEQYYLEAGTSQHAVYALIHIGNHHNQTGNQQKARHALHEALELASALNFTAGRAQALSGLGSLHQNIGQNDEAIGYLDQAFALAEQIGDIRSQTQTLSRIAFARYYLGQIDQTISAMNRLLLLARQNNLSDEVILALNNLGECHQTLYDTQRALAYHQEGWFLAETLGIPHLQADLTRNLGVNFLQLGDHARGTHYLYTALALNDEFKILTIRLQTLYNLALAEIEHGNPQQGFHHAQTLLQQAEQHTHHGHVADAHYALGLYYAQHQQLPTAHKHWQQSLFIAQDADRRQLLWRLHAALAQTIDTPALAQVHQRMAQETINQILYPLQDEQLKQTFLSAPPIKTILAPPTNIKSSPATTQPALLLR